MPKILNQLEFSTIFFDTLFGLVLFFSLDSLLEITDKLQFFFYVFSAIILIHWWLIFKSADDTFKTEVTDSALDIIFGIVDIILIEYVILSAKVANYQNALYFLIALFLMDLVWNFIWRYVGHWQTEDHELIKKMENELELTIKVNILITVPLILLAFLSLVFSQNLFIVLLTLIYAIFIFLTFRYKIIDINIF